MTGFATRLIPLIVMVAAIAPSTAGAQEPQPTPTPSPTSTYVSGSGSGGASVAPRHGAPTSDNQVAHRPTAAPTSQRCQVIARRVVCR